jgi:hypothetical protein
VELFVVDEVLLEEVLEEEEHQEAEVDLEIAEEEVRAVAAGEAAVDSPGGAPGEPHVVEVGSGDDIEEDMYFILVAFGSFFSSRGCVLPPI